MKKTQRPKRKINYYVAPLMFVGATVMVSTILSSRTASADDNTSVVDQINITVPVSCTMTGTGMNTHNAEIANGTYTPDIGTTTLHAFCNDNEGFAIYAAGYTGDEIGGTNSNKLVGTNASSNATIVSGIATTAGNPDISNWAMKLAISQDSGDTTSTNAFTIDSAPNVDLPSEAESGATQASFSSYHVVPNEYVKVAHKNSMTDMTASTGGVKLTTTYAAYISKTQPADTYTGQVIYTLVHPASETPISPRQIIVNFDANGSSFAGGQLVNQVIYTISEQPGSESSPGTTTVVASSGTYAQTTDWYGSWYAYINNQHYDFINETELIAFLTDNALTLGGSTIYLYRGLTFTEAYTRASKTLSDGYWVQQDLDANMCNTIAITQNQTVKDTRDNNVYMIGKLKDSNCWMLDNLALDPTDVTTAVNMNANNTNATQTAINNLLNGDSNVVGWGSAPVANVSSDFDTGGYDVPRINNVSKNVLVTSYGPAAIDGQAKVGIYYNFCTTSASTYCYASDSGVDVPNTIMDVSQDICPINWRIPTSGVTGEYNALAQKYSSIATEPNSIQYNLSTPLSGRYAFSSTVGQNSYGSWWSSTYGTLREMYNLRIDAINVLSVDYNVDRSYGRSIRCLVSR